MWKPYLSRGILIVLSGMVGFVSVACSSSDTPPPNAQSSAAPSPTPTVALPPPVPLATPTGTPTAQSIATATNDPLALAIDKATGAVSIAKSALNKDDWLLVINHWQEAINLLQSVPDYSSDHERAAKLLGEYQQKLADAQKKSQAPPPKPPKPGDEDTDTTSTPQSPSATKNNKSQQPAATTSTKPKTATSPSKTSASTNPNSFSIPIKRRLGGIPVIDVSLTSVNGTLTVEMLLDTGASGTLITKKIADKLGVPIVAKARATTANGVGEFALAYMQSIKVGAGVIKNKLIGVARDDLDMGLLGQDFYTNYEVTIKRNRVDFHKI